jgi:Ca-activated chloride channel family protein
MHGRIGTSKMSIKPILPVGILLLIFGILFAATAFLIIRNKLKTGEKIFSLVRMTVIYVLAFIIGLRPVVVETRYEFATKNLDVLFVVDNTMSMWALDYDGRKERMQGVKKDVSFIIDELAGSNFGLVTFDDSAHVLSPFTQDMQYIRDLFDTFESPDSYYAKGSDLSIPYKDVEALLLSSARKENRKTIVFYISDGEITNNKQLKDYSELAQYIDSGAVLGYGSEQGGKMKETYGYSYVYDYSTHKDAMSKIDEENLKTIAEQLGLQYLNMNSGNVALSGAVELIKESSKTVIESGSGAEIAKDIYYFFAYPLILILFTEIVMFVRRGRM